MNIMLPIFCQASLSAKMTFSLPRHILLDSRARLDYMTQRKTCNK